jgi:hypothetical protein
VLQTRNFVGSSRERRDTHEVTNTTPFESPKPPLMKTRPLVLITALFGVAVPIFAQTTPEGKFTKIAPPPVEVDTHGVITLNPGTVPALLEQVEASVMMTTSDPSAAAMPNVILGPGVAEVTVSTPLRLRKLTPVQSLALIAAAAGCTLEPIMDPEPQGQLVPPGASPAQAVIGYRITLPPVAVAPPSRALPSANRAAPAQPSGTLHLYKNVDAGVPTPTFTARLDEVPVPPPAGGFLVDHVKVVDPALNMPVNTVTFKALGGFGGEAGGAVSLDEGPVVRVYALGALLQGNDAKVIEMRLALESLLADAMEHAGLDKPMPSLSIHGGTKALIVKGSPTQHAIVEQIVQAMKENATAAATAGAPPSKQ